MLGLAGAHKSRARLRDDAHGWIAHILEQLPVALPCRLVPARGAAHIEAAVLVLDKAAAHIQLSQDSGGKRLDVFPALRILQISALETDLALDGFRVVACGFPDHKLSVPESGVCRHEALLFAHCQDARHIGIVLIQIGDGALRVPQVKSIIAFHLRHPYHCAETARPLRTSTPSLTSAGRIVMSCLPGRSSNHSLFPPP